MKTETITWHELPADGMPDAETTVLLILLVVALWFVFRGDPSLIDLWHRAAMQAAGGVR